MKVGGMLRDTVVASAALGAASILVGGLSGHLTFGLSIAVGLMLGSGNGYLFLALLNHGTPFLAGTMFRLVFATVLVVIVASVLGLTLWAAILGLAAAQLVMVGASVREGVRA